MISALVSTTQGPESPPLLDDLVAVGVQVQPIVQSTNLLQTAIRSAPGLIILFDSNPESGLFDTTAAIAGAAPCPVVVFTTDPDAGKIALAMKSGIHAYVVNGYGRARLRSVIHVAQARFGHEQAMRGELADVNRRFAERKLVDRARGILMGARQLREEEAYRALRSAAMQGKERIGQVAQRVIDSARYAEAVNRAGQLRMLSQRLAKLYALSCAGIRPAQTAALLASSVSHVEGNLAELLRSLSKPTFGDLLDALTRPWTALKAILDRTPRSAMLEEMDRHAGAMLLKAEQLTANLEIGGYAGALHVINVAGRQRMLCQRMAKEALMSTMLPGAAAEVLRSGMATSRRELLEGLAYLQALPLSNPEIGRELAGVLNIWDGFDRASTRPQEADAKEALAELSEQLLAHFERLTDQLERGMQSLV